MLEEKENAMKRAALALMSIMLIPGWLAAQTPIDEQRPAAPDGTVAIENISGSVKVIGWDKAEVQVTGTLAPDAELDFEATAKHVAIEVDVEGHGHAGESDLEVHVPSGSQVEIEGVNTEIEVTGLTGSVEAETVNGGISLQGSAKLVSLQNVNGAVDVSGPRGRIEVEVVNGSLTIQDASGHIEASTVNGELIVGGGPFERAALESVAGAVSFKADLAAMGRLDIETVSGGAEVLVPANITADFSISTFSGEIEDEFGIGTVQQEEYVPAKDLSFSTGSGGARITVETLSGGIHIRKR
jgi:DUF4097 and DUF4098 domain-containing protein YvlB